MEDNLNPITAYDQANQAIQEAQGQPQPEIKQEIKMEPVGDKMSPTESSKEYNLRLLRERAEQAERKAKELENQVKQLHKQKDLDDDSFVEGKEYNQLRQQFERQQQQFEEMQHQSNIRELRSNYPDIDNVVTDENLRKLAEKYPADYQLIANNTNIYQRGSVAYNMIKNYGILNKYEAEDKKIAANLKKPISIAAMEGHSADAPLTRVGDYDRRVLSEERKRQLQRQVEEAKRYG